MAVPKLIKNGFIVPHPNAFIWIHGNEETLV
jgi:hypothetical protein